MENYENWYDAMPAIYRAELETLQHGLPYFKLINQLPFEQTGGLLQYFGEISLAEDKKQIVKIVFPHSYPFSSASVYPLRGRLTTQGIELHQVQTNQGPRVTISFGRGNQYNDDRMCLYTEEEVWIPFLHGIGMVVEQAKRWLETAMSKEGFTENLIVDESNSIIPNIGQILAYMPNVLPESAKGTLICNLVKENFYTLSQVQFGVHDKVQTIHTFPEDSQLSLGRKNVIIGKWYRVADMNPKDLLPLLYKSDTFLNFITQKLKITIEEVCPDFEEATKETIVGFVIGDSKELHCFKVLYWKERLKNLQPLIIVSYLLSKNLSKELFIRIDALFNLEVLNKKKVLIVGAGSIGSEVAKELASSSVGNYVLVDEETFEVGNVVRHAADLQNIGEKKVDIVKKLIHFRNPQAKVQSFPINILQMPPNTLSALIDDADIVVDLTANKLVEGYLNNKVSLEKGKTVVQAAVSKGGLTGIILVMTPGKSACLECLSRQNLNHVPTSALASESLKETPPDYGACSKPALPASGLDTREVALQTARVVLQVLLQDENIFYPKLSGYQLYWNGPAGVISNINGNSQLPFKWQIKNAELSMGCKTCNNEQ